MGKCCLIAAGAKSGEAMLGSFNRCFFGACAALICSFTLLCRDIKEMSFLSSAHNKRIWNEETWRKFCFFLSGHLNMFSGVCIQIFAFCCAEAAEHCIVSRDRLWRLVRWGKMLLRPLWWGLQLVTRLVMQMYQVYSQQTNCHWVIPKSHKQVGYIKNLCICIRPELLLSCFNFYNSAFAPAWFICMNS